jgi:hypothetical protein
MEALLALVLVSAAADPSLAGGPGYEPTCRIRLYHETTNAPVCADREPHVRHQPVHHGVHGQDRYDGRYEDRYQGQYEVRHSERRHTTSYSNARSTSHHTGHHTAHASTHAATPGTVRLNDGFFYGALAGGVERPGRTVVYGAGRSVVVINSGGGASVAASASASARASASATVTVGGSH